MQYGNRGAALDEVRPPGDDSTPRPAERLLAIVGRMLQEHGITRSIGGDDQLTDVGLTSLDMANLLLVIEAEFDLTIPASELTPANFRCIGSLERMILTVRGGAS